MVEAVAEVPVVEVLVGLVVAVAEVQVEEVLVGMAVAVAGVPVEEVESVADADFLIPAI